MRCWLILHKCVNTKIVIPSVKARRLYKHFGDGNECDLNQHEYVAMRDHLFVCIHFSNAHRSGVSAHLTQKEFSKKEVRDGKINLMVHDHKTKRQGLATISLTHDEFEMLQIYVTKVRPQIKTSSNNVFITFNGLSMKSGVISRQIDSLWVKAGIYEKSQNRKKLSCNIIRKSTTTGTRENYLGMEQEVADLMAHSKKTADKNYFLRQKMKTASKAGDVIRDFFYGDSSNVGPDDIVLLKKTWSKSEEEFLSATFEDELIEGVVPFNQVKRKYEGLNLQATEKQIYNKLQSLQ